MKKNPNNSDNLLNNYWVHKLDKWHHNKNKRKNNIKKIILTTWWLILAAYWAYELTKKDIEPKKEPEQERNIKVTPDSSWREQASDTFKINESNN